MSQESTLANLGESESLKRTIGRLIQGKYTLVGPGDDAAVVSAPDSRYVVTTDTMIEDHDFRLDWSTGFDLGYKAIATNVSDVCAMNGKATQVLVSVALSNRFSLEAIEEPCVLPLLVHLYR